MLIIGAKGSAKDVLVLLEDQHAVKGLAFFDDVTEGGPDKLFETYPILRDDAAARKWMAQNGPDFVVAVGHTRSRRRLVERFRALGGKPVSLVATDVTIGRHSTVGEGSVILPGARISNAVTIGEGAFIGVNAIIGHDCQLGSYVTISPGAALLGYVQCGDLSYVGANSTVLPKVSLGQQVLVGAGTVVAADVADYQTIVERRSYEG